jgi:hypothetical protein
MSGSQCDWKTWGLNWEGKIVVHVSCFTVEVFNIKVQSRDGAL